MCPVKTENLSRNVARAEADFWRSLATQLNVKSRANLENFLLLEGLKAVNRSAARQLAALRLAVNPRVLGSAALLPLFVAQIIISGGKTELRSANRGNKERAEILNAI